MPTDCPNGYSDTFDKQMILALIDEAPTVDSVPVIRCKDCKYVDTDATCFFVCNREGMGLRPFHVYDDDYCSYAERREE